MDAVKTNDESPLEYKRRSYLEKKKGLIELFNKLKEILENVEGEPLSGEQRKEFMMKFSTIDHRLLDRFDIAALEYYEELEKESDRAS